MSECALQVEAGSPCSIALALGRGCLHGLPQAPCGHAPLPGTWAPPPDQLWHPHKRGQAGGSRVPLEDQSVEVTTTATCRAAAPRGAFVLIFVFIKAPPPARGCGERRDVGRPAPRLLLLLLETDGDGTGGFKCRLRSPSAPFTPLPHPGHPALRSFTPGEGPQSWAQRGAPASPQGHCSSAGGWEGRTYSHPVSRFQNHSSSPPSVSSQHPGGKELTPTD